MKSKAAIPEMSQSKIVIEAPLKPGSEQAKT
jgi:hypothetical protein